MQTKVCLKCWERKPLSDFIFYGKGYNGKDRYGNACRVCLDVKFEKQKQLAKERGKQYREKRKNDPIYRIKRNLNNRIRIALKGDFKFDSVENLTGCTFQERVI